MKVRLIKAGLSPPKKKRKQPPAEIPVIDDTVRSWVHDFRSNKAAKAHLDFQSTCNPKKT